MKNNGRHAILPALRKNLCLKYVRMMMRNAKRERSPASSLMMNGKKCHSNAQKQLAQCKEDDDESKKRSHEVMLDHEENW